MRLLEPILRHIETRETIIAVWDYPGEDPPIFFCHCAGLCGRAWDPVLRRLALNNRFLVWDARGHGDSGAPDYPGAYAWDGFSKDLLDVMDAYGLKKGVLAVGHSGGASAIVHAELQDPGRFSRVVLIDAIIAPPSFYPTAERLAVMTRKRRHVLPSLEAARARFSAKAPMNRWHPEVLEAYLTHGFSRDEAGRLHLKCRGENEAQVYACGGMVPLYERLHEVQTPALVITGEESYMLEHARAQSRLLQQADLVELPQTGHFIPQEQPDVCAERISGWFNPA
ncbi:MAG: alpha/beta hydrolase [Candidatus Hydrogenedentes bacterium]|nr:alpha/beta hydrolase [Candidatus Hydrogenedentota bacterium]